MGISGIEGVSTVSIGIALKVRVTSFIIIGHRRKGGLMGEFKWGGGMSGAEEAVNFRFKGFLWIVIWLWGGGRGGLW